MLATPLLTAGGLAAPPVLTGQQLLPAYGGWLGSQPPGTTQPQLAFNPLGFLHLADATWQQAMQTLVDALGKAKISLHLDPLANRAMANFQGQAGSNGATIAWDVYTYLGQVQDYVAGFLDVITSGFSSRMLKRTGLTWLVDKSSDAYLEGQHAGQAIEIAITVIGAMFPAAWPVMLAIGAVQALFAVGSAIDAAVDGDYRGAGELLVTAALMLGARFPGCRFGRIAALGLRAMGVVHAGFSVYNAIGQFQNGDTIGGLLSLGQAGADIFVATPRASRAKCSLDVEDGKKRADTIRVGDRLWRSTSLIRQARASCGRSKRFSFGSRRS